MGGVRWIEDLIDTQWNVNKVTEIIEKVSNNDLIDTQWNVNSDSVVHTSDKAKI